MKFGEFFGKKETLEPKKFERFLPEDVRYALQYKERLMGKEEIETLVRNNFTNEAVYLTFKSLVGDPSKHKEFLEKYISLVLNKNSLINKKEFLQEIILEALNNRDDVSVKGGKLAQLSRQGFELWQEKYQVIASELAEDERNIYLLAHSTFIGLKAFLEAFSEKNKDLNILVPEWMPADAFGYKISFDSGNTKVDWLRGRLENDKDSVLFDDTKNTGNTLVSAEEFLVKKGSKKPEVKVLDKAH